MHPRRLIWRIYPPILVVIGLSLFGVGAYTSRSFHDFYVDETRRSLQARAELVREALANWATPQHAAAVDSQAKRLGRMTGTRVTIIGASGEVLGDSDKNPALMDNHRSRPEVQLALTGIVGSAIRHSSTMEKTLLYVAVPVRTDEGTVTAVIRAALPLTSVEAAMTRVNVQILIGGLVTAVLAALVTLIVSRHISRPLEQLEQAATRFASGDLSLRLPATGSAELASLARAMNRMAAEIEDRIQTLMEERNEREAVLGGMVEAVLAVDRDERVMTINATAARLLGTTREQSLGRSIQEIARNPELQRFIQRGLASDRPIEDDLTLRGREIRYLQAHGAPIRDGQGLRIGAVVVLNDVTRLRRLETMRREFVANVSHELKTPITSIKGFVETLANGALEDPVHARRFLEITARQADRLIAIIEDLLTLARLEQDSEHGALPITRQNLRPLLLGAVEICRIKADPKRIELKVDCAPDLVAEINAPLLEQAIVNLVDNAIKYSPEASTVELTATADDRSSVISVRDFGCGIEPSHIPRLFERFYRVDKARSRSLGGTGLGLAIVKHIMQAHRGSVGVDSAPGQGSTFSLWLPRLTAVTTASAANG
jgi:two-component system phosphate regulon sensor histidine kinase PhoR